MYSSPKKAQKDAGFVETKSLEYIISTERPKLLRYLATNSRFAEALIKTKSVMLRIILKKRSKKNKKIADSESSIKNI
jgi:hypothetical protein